MADRNQDTVLFLSQMLAQGKISREQYENSVRAITEMVEPLPGIQDTVARNQQAGRQPGAAGMLAMPPSSVSRDMGQTLNEQSRSSTAPPTRPEFDRDRRIGYGQNAPEPGRDIGGNTLPSISEKAAGADVVPGGGPRRGPLSDFAEGGETQYSPSEQKLLESLTTEEAQRYLSNRRRELEEADSKVQFDTTGVAPAGPAQTNAPPAPFVPSQRMIDYEVALEEEKARKKIEAARAELAASSPVPEPVSPPPQEVIDFARRNYKQKYDNADEGMRRLIESRIREQMEPVAMGAGASDMVLFERWKNTGSWGVPYDQVPPDVIRAAQRYTVNFGPPKKSASPKEREVAPYTTLETGASYPGFAYGEDLRTGIDAYLARPESSGEIADVGRGAPMYQKEYVEPEDRELSQRQIESIGRKEASRRAGTIRAISRRPYNRRQAQLDRANENRPGALKIRPEEVGLPAVGTQRVGRVREVDSITDVSAQNAMTGEYLESPQGFFRVGENSEQIPIRRTKNGVLVPDADKMSPSDFAAQISKEESRQVADLIISSGDRELSRRMTGIRRARAQIRSDQYDDSTQESQLSRLQEMQDELQYEFLTEFLPGATEVAPIEKFEEVVAGDIQGELRTEAAQESLRENKRRNRVRRMDQAFDNALGLAKERAKQRPDADGEFVVDVDGEGSAGATIEFVLDGINYPALADWTEMFVEDSMNSRRPVDLSSTEKQIRYLGGTIWNIVAASLGFTQEETNDAERQRAFVRELRKDFNR